MLKLTLKTYQKVLKSNRIYLQDGNLHNIQEKSKKEMLTLKENIKTLESRLQNEDQGLDSTTKSL